MPRRTIIVSQSLATSNTFEVNLATRGIVFQPTKMIVRQLLYCNIGAGADTGIYLLSSSLTSGHSFGAVYCGIQGTVALPGTEIEIACLQPSVTFTVTSANTTFTGPTGHIVMTLEFIAP